MIRTIASNSCSPISKRLALRLMYAAYVLRPQLVQCNPWILKRYTESIRMTIGLTFTVVLVP